MSQGSHRLDIRDNFFMERLVRHQKELSRKVVESPSLKLCKRCMNICLRMYVSSGFGVRLLAGLDLRGSFPTRLYKKLFNGELSVQSLAWLSKQCQKTGRYQQNCTSPAIEDSWALVITIRNMILVKMELFFYFVLVPLHCMLLFRGEFLKGRMKRGVQISVIVSHIDFSAPEQFSLSFY